MTALNQGNRFYSKTMMQRATMMRAFALSTGLLLPVIAQTADCFCIEDADDAIWYDCEEFNKKEDQKRKLVIHCRPKAGMARKLIPDGPSLHRLQDGEGACIPCQVDIPIETTDTVPRNDGKRASPVKINEQGTSVNNQKNTGGLAGEKP